ncbi:Ulp1 protease family C-terminal catalytic domain [Arabidopsis suecica]|uniref:Ulp1 protease family C-terminal catalytic domain n=1 Tax=Arabidopsis suecica TaxID=45249 RepID=A0A8T1ZVK8_ARASU|nr:Ulp1 protease family C-terminal catalytic domain [Arabidopsis suecica]KAG7565871.1 Ulp1 protease family C-terminal catalytic domain [Arabidopsis suecica]
MAEVISEEQPRDYPPRLYAEGESILENKLLNHNIKMGDVPVIIESIGQDAWNELKGSPIGIIAKLAESQFVWSGKTVHFLLCRQLRIHKKEIWFLVGGQPIRFGLNEFGHITGLNTGSIPTEKFEPKADYKAFFSELNVPGGEGPKLDELRAGLLVCRTWTPEKRKWLGLLTLQAIGLYGLHHNSRIPFESAKRVFDDEAMNTYPWGRSAFEALVNSIKMLRPVGKTYTVSGMVYVLQALAYDSVKCFGERYGRVVNKDEIPLLRWGGNRTRKTMELTIAEDIKAHGELRVSKLVMKDDVRELFHTWPDEEEDPALDNLIRDIHEDKFVKGYWDVKKTEKKRKNVNSNAAGDSESPAKRQKVHNVKDVINSEGLGSGEEDAEKKKKKKKKKEKVNDMVGSAEDDVLEDVSVKTVVDLVKQLNSRFDTVDTSIKEVSSNMEKVIGDRVEARMDEKFEYMEKELKQMKERLNAIEQGVGKSGEIGEENSAFKETEPPEMPTQVNLLLNQKEKATPKGPAKPPQNQSVTSPLAKDIVDVEKDIGIAGVSKNLEKEFANVIDGKSAIDFIETLPNNTRVLRSKKIDTEKIAAGKKNTGKDKPAKDKAPKVQAAVGRRRGRKPSSTTVKKVVRKLATAPAEGGAALDEKKEAADVPDKDEEVLEKAGIKGDNDVYDVTDQLLAGDERTLPESEDDEEELIRIERINALRKESVKLSPDGSALNPLSNVSERIFPHIGDNGLTCMRKNCVPSAGIYDPLSPVDPAKLQKLKEMMAPFKHLPLGRATDTVDFYRILITERKDWPDRQYGWLYDDHIAAYLRVLRKRFITRVPFPFHTKRIAFIDSWFVSYWCKEYDQFKIKPERIKFKGTAYERLVHGLEPKDQQTNMKWIEDVDHLYIVHQIGGNHWLALDVDLVKGHIDCYDSIVGQHTKESELSVLEACRPFTRMIPKMMNEIIPPEIYPPRFEQFSFRRRNKSRVPQNSQVGDCGVYALKFIECLALGVSFVGICDENIQAIRVKMATEIYDEAPDLLAAFDVQ